MSRGVRVLIECTYCKMREWVDVTDGNQQVRRGHKMSKFCVNPSCTNESHLVIHRFIDQINTLPYTLINMGEVRSV